MKIYIKLLPPFSRPGKSSLELELPGDKCDLAGLINYLDTERTGIIPFKLADTKEVRTAEFKINGKTASRGQALRDGDEVTVIPYICGG